MIRFIFPFFKPSINLLKIKMTKVTLAKFAFGLVPLISLKNVLNFVLLLVIFLACCESAYLDEVPRCIPVVTSDDTKSGNLTSPNYPRYYPQNTHCRYDFVGHANERVQIVFTDFNLFHPDDGFTHQRDPDKLRIGFGEIERKMGNGRNLDCSASDVDVLSAFVYYGDKLARIDDFCGSTPPLAIMSNGNRLTLEFKAPSSSTYVRGFSALYRFVTDFGISNGRQDQNLPCRFYFNSNETSNGTFTSPNYPGYYPRDTECHYFFQGKENEHVELHFTYFHIDGVQPCDGDTYSDYVEFSNYIPTDRKYDRKCGTESGFKVRSDRKFFRVNFHSNDRYDATGFQATYQFSDKANQLTIRNVRSSAISTVFSSNNYILSLLLQHVVLCVSMFKFSH